MRNYVRCRITIDPFVFMPIVRELRVASRKSTRHIGFYKSMVRVSPAVYELLEAGHIERIKEMNALLGTDQEAPVPGGTMLFQHVPIEADPTLRRDECEFYALSDLERNLSPKELNRVVIRLRAENEEIERLISDAPQTP